MAKKTTFESGMAELESIAQQLESGSMTLEESFTAYEKAMKLKNTLEKLLDEGEKKIKILTATGENEISSEDI